MNKGQLISATDYDFLILGGVGAMQRIETLSMEMINKQNKPIMGLRMSNKTRQLVANTCFNLIEETLIRHGPKGQNHRRGLNAAYKRFADGRQEKSEAKIVEFPEENDGE